MYEKKIEIKCPPLRIKKARIYDGDIYIWPDTYDVIISYSDLVYVIKFLFGKSVCIENDVVNSGALIIKGAAFQIRDTDCFDYEIEVSK